eukprot:gene13350-16276_t
MKLNLTVLEKPQKSIWLELEEGFKYVSRDRELSSMILMIGISSFWFESAAGLGSVISAMYLANLRSAKPLLRIMIIASTIFGLSLIFLAYSGILSLALVFMTFSGLGMMAQTSAINTYIQTHTIPAMRARAISYYIMAYQGMIPIGSLIIGWTAQAFGPRLAVCLAGIIGLCATAAFVAYKTKSPRGHLSMLKLLHLR